MAPAWLNQPSQTDIASTPSLLVHDEGHEPSVTTTTNGSQIEPHAEAVPHAEDHHQWEHRSVEGSERSYPESVDPDEGGSVQEAGPEVAVADIPSAPIAVPIPSRDSRTYPPAASSASGSTDYDLPAIPHYIGGRKTSIGFDPKVKVDGKDETILEAPLPKLSLRTRGPARSMLDVMAKREQKSRARSETDSQEYDPETGERIDERPPSARDPRYNTNQPRWPLLQSTVDELASNEQPGRIHSSSLTSNNSLPSLKEFHMAPPMNSITSPVSIPSPRDWFGPSSSELPRRLSSRSRSYYVDRTNGARRMSRRSTLTSSASPASAFLSRFAPSSPVANPDDEGQEVGDYVLGRQIGFGGFSLIREAFTLRGTEHVARAVKIVRRHDEAREESENEALQAEFEHEIQIWRTLRHPHILPLLTVYDHPFATFAITQLITSGTLFDAVRKNPGGLEPRLARRYVAQLSTALRYLHEDRRMVHRDLKLENCLVDMTAADANEVGGNLLLCDFGLADYYDTDSSGPVPSRYASQALHPGPRASTFPPTAEHSQTNGSRARAPTLPPPHALGPADTSTNFAGSLPYAAPEMLEHGPGMLSTAIDMWALGVLCFAVVVGKLPFSHTFLPTLRTMIIRAKWDREKVKTIEKQFGAESIQNGSQEYFDRSITHGESSGNEGALDGIYDIIEGCLTVDPAYRWDIQDVLNCTWLRDEVDSLEIDE